MNMRDMWSALLAVVIGIAGAALTLHWLISYNVVQL